MTKLTEMDDQKLFELLARDNDKSHPPFLSADGFFWLWERMQDNEERWEKFWVRQLGIVDSPWAFISSDWIIHHLLKDTINPVCFLEAVKEFMEQR